MVHIGAPKGYAGIDPDTVVDNCLWVNHDAKPAMQQEKIAANFYRARDFRAEKF